jgi:hypothetical protein
MKASELRIGSLIEYRNTIFEVGKIGEEFINVRLSEKPKANGEYTLSPSIHISQCRGVKIDNKILTQAGFELYPWGWIHGDIRLTISHYRYQNDNGANKKMEYIHELQNLILAITDSELDIEKIKLIKKEIERG